MDLMFNELSLQPSADGKTQAFKHIHRMLNTFKKVNQYGYNKIRFEQTFDEIELYPGYTIADFCNEPTNRTHKALLLGLGLVIRTTGRNLKETEKIAELLKEEYN